jgi:hypothetical protein
MFSTGTIKVSSKSPVCARCLPQHPKTQFLQILHTEEFPAFVNARHGQTHASRSSGPAKIKQNKQIKDIK